MIAPWKIGTTVIRFTAENVKGHIYAFSTRDHITHRAYGYHTIASMSYIEKLKSQKFFLYFLIRNPLDMMVSLIKKQNNSEHIDTALIYSVSRNVIGQLNYWVPYLSKLDVLRYENLINNPIQKILNIMTKLKIKPSKSIATHIWDQVGFKQLPSAPKNHFTGGGAGKWEKYFKNEHLSYLKNLGIENLLEKYGYLDVLERFRILYSSIPQGECETNTDDPRYTTARITLDEHQDTLQFLQPRQGPENCVECGSLYIQSNNPELLNKIKNAFENEYIQKIMLAGAHPDYRLV
jgi:hypothetical protein